MSQLVLCLIIAALAYTLGSHKGEQVAEWRLHARTRAMQRLILLAQRHGISAAAITQAVAGAAAHTHRRRLLGLGRPR